MVKVAEVVRNDYNLSPSRYVASKDVVDCDIGGERALMHLGTNTYFTMNGTGSVLGADERHDIVGDSYCCEYVGRGLRIAPTRVVDKVLDGDQHLGLFRVIGVQG